MNTSVEIKEFDSKFKYRILTSTPNGRYNIINHFTDVESAVMEARETLIRIHGFVPGDTTWTLPRI